VNLPSFAALVVAGVAIASILGAWLFGVRDIPHSEVGMVETLRASKGSLTEGRIVATNGEAGYPTEILGGGGRALFDPWQFRIHREPLAETGGLDLAGQLCDAGVAAGA
jgi:hypothetical protein